ncbi:hypothetical protein HBH70_071420 [Parastagonospora nodorum]|nr:hypothetical protein HBI06_166550 [Parastagonospora nodorum]KAH4237272.1 hypothetical protein HBI05_128970 [Parastagonospora nodorum]KAH4259021.1 hypothetical protein HBI03_140050 [Parastagonospora nodorum]KAH4276486.1 hypothetical protein HBI04_109370 [Parastagonospora nodorum]KAH4969051.1 hypothetical protein HBI78_061820 [Parastagonospora nodorum]
MTDMIVPASAGQALPGTTSPESSTIVTSPGIWPEPLDTPGIVPRHLKRSATTSFPILEVIQRILSRLRPQGTSSDIEKVLAVIGLYQAVQPVYGLLRDFFFWAFTVEITVAESDPVAKEIMAWMGAQVIRTTHARSAMLVTGGLENTNLAPFTHPMRFSHPPMGGEGVDAEVACLPSIGTRVFWVGFRPFLFSRSGGQSQHRHMISNNPLNDRGQLQNALMISTLGWSLTPLRKFTDLCHKFKLRNLTGTTTVYFAGGSSDPYGDGWQSVSKAVRKLDTIDMDEQVKSDLIKDAENYYSEQSRGFFADCGIPYRRGYLFHGPPGTGKSSFSAALAGHLRCDIYHINLASGDFSDGNLHRLFLGLPRKCVVVIEDIDSAGIGREQGPKKKPQPVDLDMFGDLTSMPSYPSMPGFPKPPPMPLDDDAYKRTKRNTVTLSGLLNAIDGNASQEGRLLIMTSNNPDALDAALIRPGRIDKKVYFGNMSKSAGKSIYMRLIGRSALAHDAAFTMAEIEQYATEFADKIPANTFTPAQVQNFLQDCRADPLKALREVDAWVAENREKSGAMSATGSSDMSASIISHVTQTPPTAENGKEELASEIVD